MQFRVRSDSQQWLSPHAGRTVLVSFLLLNGLLFLPLWLLNWDETTLWPLGRLQWGDGWLLGQRLWQQLVVGRDNFDPFRFNVELCLFLALFVNIRWLRRPALRHLFIGLYFLILCYYIYEAITLSLYQSEPVFYNHYYMALDGLGYLFGHLSIANGVYWGVVLLLGVAIWLIYRLAALFYQSTLSVHWGLKPRLFFSALGLLMLFVLITEKQTLAAPTTVFSSLSYKVEENIEKSLKLYREITNFDDTALQQTYDYASLVLPNRPNIYFLFVESYGSVLYKRPDYRIDYSILLKGLKRQLDEAGWQSASTLSIAPTWGGGSWLSYTSTEFGLHIDNHPYYLTLLNKYQYERYPHLGNFLHDQGYQTYRLSSLSVNLAQDSWERYERMYDVDGWFHFEDLHFTGPLYGWGPAAPDQYALNFTREALLARTSAEQPFMLFFITQNSHYPFAPYPTLVDDWRTLNTMDDDQGAIDDEARAHDVRRQDYFSAISYDLHTLTKFIVDSQDEDALFILIGDHQPPRVSRREDGFDTPIHIISRDPNVIAAFAAHDFTPGLWVNGKEPTMQHEGFYSMLVRALLYDGENLATLPPYLPRGFVAPSGE